MAIHGMLVICCRQKRNSLVRYNVSRNTLRKALSLLEGEGIIHRKHGSGTYIQKRILLHTLIT